MPRRPRSPLRAALAGAALLTGCGGEAAAPAGTGLEAPVFESHDVDVGLDFVHFNGMSGQLFFCEIMGAGGALFDAEGDGDLDAYLVQGHMLGAPDASPAALRPLPPDDPPRDRLFRNLLEETGTLRFQDVTDGSGIVATGYGIGVAAGDVDNDGDVDLYVTNFGSNQLLANAGNGTFTDVTIAAGADDERFSATATFVDYDRDGWLDLFVGNYVRFTLALHKECWARSTVRDYCGPKSYEPQPDRLLHNRGDGTYEVVTEAAGMALTYGAALGVVADDLNGDGWPDLYVCNDALANQLWINRGDGTFGDTALMAGCAYNAQGLAEASMGIDAADFDGDGDDDLIVTHMHDETNTLYVNDGTGVFHDGTLASGLAAGSRQLTGFGTGWLDIDNDTWLDLVIANGAVRVLDEQVAAGEDYPLLQANQLFHNAGAGRFVDVTEQAGPAFVLAEVSRGAALGDVDNDGDTDVLVTNSAGRAHLLLNRIGSSSAWLGLRLLTAQGRDAYGARVGVHLDDGRVLWRRAGADGSYASSRDPRVLVGLGERAVERVDVVWPGGGRETWDWTTRATSAYHTLEEGGGDARQ